MKTSRSARYFPIFILSALMLLAPPAIHSQELTGSPVALTVDSLVAPIGIDSAQPRFSWKLRDARSGARQTSYQIQIATSSSSLQARKADVWDSGRTSSDASINVPYAGPALAPTKVYFWRVLVWDKVGKPYPPSDVTSFETGLMNSQPWQARWIGYELPEERSIREADAPWITNPAVDGYQQTGTSRHDFRVAFQLAGPVKHADLFVTGEDTAAAWVNGKQILEATPLPPWKQMPWKKYVRRDVTSALASGNNLLAVEIVLYTVGRNPAENRGRTPMNAVLYIEAVDGSVKLIKSGDSGWKASLDAAGDWQAPTFAASWPDAVPYGPGQNDFGDPQPLGKPWQTGPVKMLRHEFQIDKPVVSARLYATALGAYQFHLNGQRVGDQILSPGWMDFREHVPYQVYDVTKQLKLGPNAIGALLAPGWYTTPLMWFGQGYNYGVTPPALRAQLRIEHTDGSIDWIATDSSWQADVSPILFAEIYDGETFDSRRVQPGWDQAAFTATKWKPADLVTPIEPKIVAQYFQPIRAEKTLTAKSISNPKPGVFVFDFGQNLGGVPLLHVSGPAGTDIQIRFAEIVNEDGTIYTDNLRTAKATDHFILAGSGTEEFQPQFTFHGFRYAELSGFPGKPTLDSLQAVVFHTDAPFTTELKTGSPMINQLWSNILWGQRSNFVGVPTDCPQRDERLGWAADAQVFWRAASYNMELAAFSRKFSGDLVGTQAATPMYGFFAPGTETPNPGYGSGWSDAGVVIPWTSWIQTGDMRVIEENWDGMTKYLAAILAANPDHLWNKNSGVPFGDWLSPEGMTPENIVSTAYWAYDVDMMRQMAHAAGKTQEEQMYADLWAQIKTAFIAKFTRPDGFVGGPISPTLWIPNPDANKIIETQAGYVLALHMNLLPENVRPLAAQRLLDRIAANKWRLGTGFLGTPYLLESLSDTGHADVAYRLLLNTEYPSWGYLVDKGATTMWERWNGDQMRGEPGMNSYNHYAYGAVADWIYRRAAGIDTLSTAPGFHTIVLRPNFDPRLGNLDFSYDSSYGTIHSAWSVKGNAAKWQIAIPPNATAVLPVTAQRIAAFTLNGKPLNQTAFHSHVESGETWFDLPAGTYSFEVALPDTPPSAATATPAGK